MNTTKTTLNGKEIEMRFGTWSIIQLGKQGIKLSEIDKFLTENLFEAVCKIAYLSACNAVNKGDLTAYEENDFYEWIDEHGMNSDEVVKVVNGFVNWITIHSPKETKAKKK